MYIQQSTLRSKSSNYAAYANSITASAQTLENAFLCHSHLDVALVKGLVSYFREKGVELYVDWEDASLPPKPDKRTALAIKQRIRNDDVFLFLATQNSVKSRWCPWEIGVADSLGKRVLIIPTQDTGSTYGNEYLELYERIVISDKGNVAAFAPGVTKNGDRL